MLTPTPMQQQTNSVRPISELEPFTPPPVTVKKRGLPTWVTIVAFIAAAVFLVASVGLYMSRADAIDSRDAALAQVTQLQGQVDSLNGQVADLNAQVTDLKATNGQLNKQVDACQTIFKMSYLIGTGQLSQTPTTTGQFMDAMNGCYGTSVPPFVK
jgi:TolA-binding protein